MPMFKHNNFACLTKESPMFKHNNFACLTKEFFHV